MINTPITIEAVVHHVIDAAGTRREARTLARAFGLGRMRARNLRQFRFERGLVRLEARGWVVTVNKPSVEIPPAISAEVLRRAAAGDRLGTWVDSVRGEAGYHGFAFSRLDVVYDHVLDRVVREPFAEIEAEARRQDLGTMITAWIEGSRDEPMYRRVVEFERGRIIADRDFPDRLFAMRIARGARQSTADM